ncbi:hypothetical protein BOTBODRAFT_33031 [Botryobasidium botryosum FD-172 SS1]|uniref:Translationally-controlled tumor protein homolog n=1 Tax=Botryobasidium botryosum (strain FD-172 SS1) TaxID=930990 RepID=A0A067MRM5_BOTB1|nr:hypothetical protein BOTBODRAFT_33031 [Botryobasidium botryosum FD-172 SS1]
MLLYEDILTGSEMFSDAFPVKETDGMFYEVDCALIIIKEGEVDIGGNPSAEEQAEALEDGAQQVNNVVHSFRLQPTSFDAKSYKSYMKSYSKALLAKLTETDKDAAAEFKKGAQASLNKILENIKNYEFYTGETHIVEATGAEGMVALLNYREDGITPYFTFWKHGLKAVKL